MSSNQNVETKDSGFEWIGEIPKHWTLKKITHVTHMIGSGTTPKSDNKNYYEGGNINWLVTGDLNDSYVFQTSNKITQKAVDEISSLRIYSENSLLIAMYGATIGKLGILKTETTVNQATCVLKFDGSNSVDFWFYVFLGNRNYLVSLGYGGGQPNISQDVIKSLRFPSPPTLEEQKLISRYLDKKTIQINLLIEKLKKKTSLIKEGILNHYFESEIRKTRLNAHPACWFQRIPEDWDIVKFRQLFEPVSIKNNSTYERLLSVTQDKGVVFRDEQERDVVNPGGDTSSYKLVTPGDVIISLRSADGGLEVSDVRGLVSPAYIVLRPKLKYDRNFYRYLLTSKNFIVELNRYIKGIRDGKNIYFDDIKDVLIPYFPSHEQNRSYQKVVTHHENLVKSFSIIERKISYLNEFRQSLISSVVTGKVRVTEDMI